MQDNVSIEANCVITGAEIATNCVVGPFARIRQGSKILQQAKIGNFVEIKNSSVGAKSKINHLSYVGDAVLGKNVNIGAGTITCNYDGVNKHQTIIEDEVFVGSNTQLIAPVVVGKRATIAAGTTLIKDAPAGKLTLTVKQQSTLDSWRRADKKRDK